MSVQISYHQKQRVHAGHFVADSMHLPLIVFMQLFMKSMQNFLDVPVQKQNLT